MYVRTAFQSTVKGEMEKAVLFGAQFLKAPQAEFGESLGRCSR